MSVSEAEPQYIRDGIKQQAGEKLRRLRRRRPIPRRRHERRHTGSSRRRASPGRRHRGRRNRNSRFKDAKDHYQEDEEDVEQLETENVLDYAIEYKMKGAYPPGLTKDKKRAVRKRAQTICIEEGEVYIWRKKNKVCNNVCPWST